MDTQRFCLDRGWRFTNTPHSVLPRIITHDTVYAYAKGDGAQGPAMLNFNDGDWEPVDLPHDWQHTEPYDMTGVVSHGYQRTGVGWYRRTFLLDTPDADGDITLQFDGISGVSDVYVNGAKLTHNESCYNGFALRLTDIANFHATPNVVAVRVDKTAWEGWWYEGCGINRHVWLVKRPWLHLADDGIWVKPQLVEGTWHAQLEWKIENAGSETLEGLITAEVIDPRGAVVCTLEHAVRVEGFSAITAREGCMLPDPKLWDIEAPNLYTLRTSLASTAGRDTVQTRFGLRTTRFDAQEGFFLNGCAVKLYGVCNHLDHAGIGATIPLDLWRYRIQLLKGMGCNAYRCSHNPPPPELLDVCDELGVLVMDENRSFSTSENALHLLRAMVRRDRNHPCVIMYSLFNEEPMQGTPKGRRLALRMRAELRKLDDTRPCIGALNGGMFEADGAATALDITGINYFLDSFDRFHKQFPNQPVLSSETVSAFATRGCVETDDGTQVFSNYDEACADWGETVREANMAVLTRPFMMGLFVWTGFDYRGEPTPHEWPSVSSHFGVMDSCGFPKDTYYLYRAFWTKEPSIHVLPHWNHRRGTEVRVMAYTNCEEAELFLNGRSLGRQPNDMALQVTWRVKFEAGELKAVGYRGGLPAAEDGVRTAGTVKRLRLEAPIHTLYHDTDSIAAINISCEDERGVFCPKENTRLTITVVGGRLLGVGNGDPNRHERDDDSRVRLFNGRAQALIAADGTAAQVRVTVFAERFGEACITLLVGQRPFPGDVPTADMRVINGWRVSHTALLEKPDVDDMPTFNDVNSMEPITFTGTWQTVLDGRAGSYALYRAKADIGPSARGRYLVLNAVQGTVEVYVNRRMLKRQECFIKSRVEVEVPTSLFGECQLTLVLQNDTVDRHAGILEPICLIHSQRGTPARP